MKSDSNEKSFSRANSKVSVIFVMKRLISTYARRKRSSSPLMSKTDSGLQPFAIRFAASSSKRTLPSLFRSFQLKKMSALMPPSTPAVTRPSEIAAPTAISACSCRDGQRVALRVVRIEEEALEQRGRVARRDEVGQALRVVAEPQVELRGDAALERADERPDDREDLPVVEREPELRQLDLDERDRLAEEQVDEARRVLEDRELDRRRAGEARLELRRRRALRALHGRRRQRVGNVEVRRGSACR